MSPQYDPNFAKNAREARLKEEAQQAKDKDKPGKPEPKPVTIPSQESLEITDKERYLVLRGRKHGDYEYPDLAVEIYRMQFSQEVEQAANSLELTVANTALTKNKHSHDYIGNIYWVEALKLNLVQRNRTLNLRQGIDFLLDLQAGIEGSKVIEYANGKPAPKELLRPIYSEIIGVRKPWRGEWLDADFKFKDDKLYIHYDHELQNGIFAPKGIEPLEAYLQGKFVKVKLADFNRQGLATRESSNGELHFLCPDKGNNSVARFNAHQGLVYLECSMRGDIRDYSLGVRRVRILGGNK